MGLPIVIAPVRSAEDIAASRRLFEAYAASLDIDLAYQGFAAELATLPGAYSPPAGELLLARDADHLPVGCVALRALGGGACEVKRLFVAPEGRGRGIGELLVRAVLFEARERGYNRVYLDTLPSMAAALRLYRSLGFEDAPPYYDSPVPETLFLTLALDPD